MEFLPLSCNRCNTTLLDKLNFNNGQITKVCCNCMNIDPRNKEIVNAMPYYPTLPTREPNYQVLPDIIIPNQSLNIIVEEKIKTPSTKPNFTVVHAIEHKETQTQPTIQINKQGKIWIDWSDVIGYDSIKYVFDQALNSTNKKKTHLLVIGAAGTSKTVFLLTAKESLEQQGIKVHYLDASTLSSSGVIEYLFTNDIDNSILEIDELDKCKKEHQAVFLNMLESGLLQETKNKKIRQKKTNNVLCFATGNYRDKILDPLLTRFMKFEIPSYTESEFKEIGYKLLQNKFKKSIENAEYITNQVWDIYTKQHITPNLRYARQVAEITNNDRPGIDKILNAITKYSKAVIVK
jgi:Holliday junction resolvasome RuvABC ATP-dependent DNA helicase subunit